MQFGQAGGRGAAGSERTIAARPLGKGNPAHSFLLCRAGACRGALPVAEVVETMRPMPVQPLPDAPSFVRGAAVVRGEVVPVVSLAALVDPGSSAAPRRLVTVRSGEKVWALEVDEVLGVERLPEDVAGEPPPLLAGRTGQALGVLDGDLLVVLRGIRVVPSEVWESIESGLTASGMRPA